MNSLGSFNKHFFPYHVIKYMSGESAMELMKTCVLFWNMFRWDQGWFWKREWEKVQPRQERVCDDEYVNYMAARGARQYGLDMVKNITNGQSCEVADLVRELLVHIVLFEQPCPSIDFEIERTAYDIRVHVIVRGPSHNWRAFMEYFLSPTTRSVCGYMRVEFARYVDNRDTFIFGLPGAQDPNGGANTKIYFVTDRGHENEALQIRCPGCSQ
jgi:hypothetical protein